MEKLFKENFGQNGVIMAFEIFNSRQTEEEKHSHKNKDNAVAVKFLTNYDVVSC